MQKLKKTNNQDDEKDQKLSSDDRTQEKLDKHLTDINDKISDEDMRNVNTDIIPGDQEVINNKKNIMDEDEKNSRKDDKTDIEKGEANEQIPTAFNILGS